MQKQPLRLGVDVAGTCAEAVLGRGCDLFSTKVLPPYSAPEEAIIKGMACICKLMSASTPPPQKPISNP